MSRKERISRLGSGAQTHMIQKDKESRAEGGPGFAHGNVTGDLLPMVSVKWQATKSKHMGLG